MSDKELHPVCVCVCVLREAIMATAADSDRSVAAASSSGSDSTARTQRGRVPALTVLMSALSTTAVGRRYTPPALALLTLTTFYIGHRFP